MTPSDQRELNARQDLSDVLASRGAGLTRALYQLKAELLAALLLAGPSPQAARLQGHTGDRRRLGVGGGGGAARSCGLAFSTRCRGDSVVRGTRGGSEAQRPSVCACNECSRHALPRVHPSEARMFEHGSTTPARPETPDSTRLTDDPPSNASNGRHDRSGSGSGRLTDRIRSAIASAG